MLVGPRLERGGRSLIFPLPQPRPRDEGILDIERAADATGRAIELPVRSNYKYGLDPLEYFTATRGTRKSLVDIALRTADSGYLTRRLVDVAQDVFTIDQEVEDPGFSLHRSDSELINIGFGKRLAGRYAAENVKKYVKTGELITEADAIVGSIPVIAGGKKPAYFQTKPARPPASTTVTMATLRFLGKGWRRSAISPSSNISSQPPLEPDQYKHARAPNPSVPTRKALAPAVKRSLARQMAAAEGGSSRSSAPARALG